MMTSFEQCVFTLPAAFKHTHRRSFSEVKRRHIPLAELGIRRDEVRLADDVSLYHKVAAVQRKLTTMLRDPQHPLAQHTGIEGFCEELQQVLDAHVVHEGKVIHGAKQAARALVNAIQLTDLPAEALTNTVGARLHGYAYTIALFGDKATQQKYSQLLKQRLARHYAFFSLQIAYFSQQLEMQA